MQVTINGASAAVSNGLTVAALLVEQKVKWADMVTVELNGVILDRAAFGSTVVQPQDRIEFLYFMGGGAAGPGPRAEVRRP